MTRKRCPRYEHVCAARCSAAFSVALSGCGVGVELSTAARENQPTAEQTKLAETRPQLAGTCKVAPPEVQLPSGDWTATATILSTEAIDACVGQKYIRPWTFRLVCLAGQCKTYLHTFSYYGEEVAEVVPTGVSTYEVAFPPTNVPCPHRPREDTGTNRVYTQISFWWSSPGQSAHRGKQRPPGRPLRWRAPRGRTGDVLHRADQPPSQPARRGPLGSQRRSDVRTGPDLRDDLDAGCLRRQRRILARGAHFYQLADSPRNAPRVTSRSPRGRMLRSMHHRAHETGRGCSRVAASTRRSASVADDRYTMSARWPSNRRRSASQTDRPGRCRPSIVRTIRKTGGAVRPSQHGASLQLCGWPFQRTDTGRPCAGPS